MDRQFKEREGVDWEVFYFIFYFYLGWVGLGWIEFFKNKKFESIMRLTFSCHSKIELLSNLVYPYF